MNTQDLGTVLHEHTGSTQVVHTCELGLLLFMTPQLTANPINAFLKNLVSTNHNNTIVSLLSIHEDIHSSVLLCPLVTLRLPSPGFGNGVDLRALVND